MRANPWIDEPSKPMPSFMAVSSSSAVITKVFRKPRTSVNHRWMNSTSFSRIVSMAFARRPRHMVLPVFRMFRPNFPNVSCCSAHIATIAQTKGAAMCAAHTKQEGSSTDEPATPKGNDATRTSNRSKDVVPGSGICTRCVDGCRGNCEVFKSSFRGREVIYPGPFGEVTAGGDKDYPIDYSHLNIMGYALGAKGLPDGVEGNPDNTLFPMVEHRDRVRRQQQGQDAGADLHRRARFDRDRPQELGALRGRRRDLRRLDRLRRERVRHRPGARARQQRQGRERARHEAPRRGVPPLPQRATATSSCR